MLVLCQITAAREEALTDAGEQAVVAAGSVSFQGES
jgi:hypothetical protein